MTDVGKSEISFIVCTIMVFCCILHCFVGKFVCSSLIYAVLLQNWFLRFARFCVEKNLVINSARGEKNDKYEVCDMGSVKPFCKFMFRSYQSPLLKVGHF